MSEFLPVFRNESGRKAVFQAYDTVMSSAGVRGDEIYISTRAGETHVMVSGNAGSPPLLLIHAYYASAASWYRNINALSENFRVYNVDIIGDPNKSRPVKVIRALSDFVDWFDDLMNGLKLESAYFMGNSVGAFHIANYALHAPARIRKMVLVGPAATFRQIMPFYVHTFPGGMTGLSFLVRHAVNWVENGVAFEPEFRNLFYLSLKHGKATNQVFPRVLKDEELKRIKIPTLLIYGDREAIYDYDLAIARAKSLMDNLDVVVVKNANHITAATNAAAVDRAVVGFLGSSS